MSAMAKRLLLLFLLLSILSTYSSAISISCTTGDGGGAVSSSTTYNLDDSTSLRERVALERSEISQDRYASGSGKNSLTQNVAGTDYSAQLTIDSVGSFSTSSSVRASESEAGISLELAAAGDAAISLQASQGEEASGQAAAVSGGAISSLQSLSTGEGVSSSQDTDMAGMEGYVGSGTFSSEDALLVTGSFLGAGTMSARMSSEASSGTGASAEAAVDGREWLSSQDLEAVAGTQTGMAVEGLRWDAFGEVGSFKMNAASMSRADYLTDLVQAKTQPEEDGVGSTAMYLNNPSAYVLAGWKWTTTNPQISLVLKDDANLRNEGLSPEAAKNAIAAAANVWDDAVAQNLFADANTVIVTTDPNIKTDTRDYKNVHAWAPVSGGLAYARTYYSSAKVDGYYRALESDVVYNTNVNWATDGRNYDVQAVAMHELGHTIGLGDLYNKAQFSTDTDEIMHYYSGARRSLGPGDRAGASLLYGRTDGAIPVFRMYSPIAKDHFYTTNYAEYTTGAVKVGYQQEGLMGYVYPNSLSGMVPIYRMYSPIVKDHFYTTNYAEYTTGAVKVGYQQEGLMGYIYSNSLSGMIPIYRMYSPYVTDHFYTAGYAEYTTDAVKVGYLQEGLMGYMSS